MKRTTVALLCAHAWLFGSSLASAQMDEDLIPETHSFVSPEHFGVEFRVGPYHPDMGTGNDAFEAFYSDDDGPLLALELDVIAYRFDDIVYFSGGGEIGTVHFKGKTLDMQGNETAEETSFSMLPLQLLATVRFDALARELSVPFIITGKLGYQWAHWSTESGDVEDAEGWSVGLTWAAQLALDLDTFEPGAARMMDEEWGINHSFVFFELNEFKPSSESLPLRGVSWIAGLGFTF